jgi:hypothetical protein
MITCAVLMIMLVGCQTNTANSEATTKMPDPTTQTSEPFSFSKLKEATLMTVLEVPVGTGDGELSYGDIGDNGVAASGPSDFAVAANGDVYILDNYHGNGDDRISVYSQGIWERNLDYSAIVSYGINLTILDDSLYVFDHNYYQGDAYIIKMTLAGDLQDKYLFSREDTPIEVWRLINMDDQVVVAAYNACYELDDATKKAKKSDLMIDDEFVDMYRRKVTFGHLSWTVPIESLQTLPTPIGKTDKDELYVAYGGAEYICKCDVNGEPVSIVKLDELLKETVYIRSSFYVAADGTLYIMVGHQDAVRVYIVQ